MKPEGSKAENQRETDEITCKQKEYRVKLRGKRKRERGGTDMRQAREKIEKKKKCRKLE